MIAVENRDRWEHCLDPCRVGSYQAGAVGFDSRGARCKSFSQEAASNPHHLGEQTHREINFGVLLSNGFRPLERRKAAWLLSKTGADGSIAWTLAEIGRSNEATLVPRPRQ